MMTTDPRLMAVHESVHVGCPIEEAFALFTTGMGEWWPLDKASYGGDRAKDIFLEPHVGGRFSSDSSTATSSRSAPSSSAGHRGASSSPGRRQTGRAKRRSK
jgi:hypothetical protein